MKNEEILKIPFEHFHNIELSKCKTTNLPYPIDLHFRYIQSLEELLDFKDKSAEDAKTIYE